MSKYINKKLDKWPCHNIEINNDDEKELIYKTQKFINDLENDYKIFIELRNKTIANNKIYFDLIEKNEKDILCSQFDFELCFKKSPLTIFDAPWGLGKTYFFESLIKFLLIDKIQLSVFKNIIIIDVWKYSYITDIPSSLISEILDRLANGNEKLIKKNLILHEDKNTLDEFLDSVLDNIK